jgi:sialate O-acetylesterase
MKGVIWYQGESNDAKEYPKLFTTMLKEWRREWGQGDFPFLSVQITYHDPFFREVQEQLTRTIPNSGMVVISDHGRIGDSHPLAKEPVGERLALAARAMAYGEKIEYSGPVYESVKFEGSKAIVKFSHLGGGLVAREDTLKGFQLAGPDKQFQVAEAKIVGDTVVVTCDKVSNPIAIRYGFLDRPITKEICEANGCVNDNFGAGKYCPGGYLANKAGLTAAPFRSDDWPKK